MDKILFFDGICVMCNGLVDLALKHDRKKRFRFAILQGSTAKRLIPEFVSNNLHTVVLVDETGTYTQSDAIIRLLEGFGGVFCMAKAFRIFPKILRDSVYRWIAKNRYRWFGKRKSCRMPSEEEKDRILD